MSGYQPTLKAPPVSTVLGLINACAGKYMEHTDTDMGYYFKYACCVTDLETIYQFEAGGKGAPSSKVKSNVIRRELLYDCQLFIYLKDERLVEFFRYPHYSILLGRSSDIASVDEIETVELQEIDGASKIKGQVVPFNGNYLPGIIQALPLYFTDTIPRRNIGTEPFSVISYDSPDFPTKLRAFRDNIGTEEVDIYLHHLHL